MAESRGNRADAISATQVAEALNAADAVCRARDAKLTELRRDILELLLTAAKPLSAYKLLERYEKSYGRKLGPPTMYRALDFLMEFGLVSRIESRNAFVPCAQPGSPRHGVFFVCNQCSTSVEVENRSVEELIESNASHLGFRISRRVMELEGTCVDCLESSSGKPTFQKPE